MKKKEIISLIILAGVYLLFSLRYFPDDFVKTAVETVLQILKVAPLAMGGTILLVSFLQRTSGQKLLWDRVVRIYLTLGVMAEFIFGVYDYLKSTL